ncbi:VOC family protein [Paenibacillus humicola]|uniref:VOC family protein n=1 Tax=Paenibacillus humicola TaxID=3110540 RepID=UPI00237B1943|nr:VOC family protein [Paenibacillus humicola]
MKTGHVGLNVTQLQRSIDFYRGALGLEVIFQSSGEADRRFAYLGHDGQITLTLWEQSEGAFGPSRPGLHHLAFEAESIEDVKEAERRLRGLGIRLIYDGVVPHAEDRDSGGLFFLDPDGIRLEIYSAHGAADHADASTDGPACGFF